MKKINIAELLRDCPKGMELDCTMFDNVTFVGVNNNREQFPIEIAVGGLRSKYLTKEGCFHDPTLLPEAKCVIFPEGKTTWEGFIPPCQFKDGDVVVAEDDESIQLFLLKHFIRRRNANDYNGDCYFGWDFQRNELFKEGIWSFERLATEEEKAKLFQAIKDNGYKWNDENKTLEKLVEPKFKVGDKIKHKNGYFGVSILKINTDCYTAKDFTGDQVTIDFTHQDDYELVPNKFDITTLKPFDKVLARDCNEDKWNIDFFGYYRNNGTYQCMTFTKNQCIPYEGNGHLLSKTDDCDDFYKTWEK